jgi:hypothetical protein
MAIPGGFGSHFVSLDVLIAVMAADDVLVSGWKPAAHVGMHLVSWSTT